MVCKWWPASIVYHWGFTCNTNALFKPRQPLQSRDCQAWYGGGCHKSQILKAAESLFVCLPSVTSISPIQQGIITSTGQKQGDKVSAESANLQKLAAPWPQTVSGAFTPLSASSFTPSQFPRSRNRSAPLFTPFKLVNPEFAKRGVKVAAISHNDVESHKGWIQDIEAYTPGAKVGYPIIADPEKDLATKLGSLDPDEKDA